MRSVWFHAQHTYHTIMITARLFKLDFDFSLFFVALTQFLKKHRTNIILADYPTYLFPDFQLLKFKILAPFMFERWNYKDLRYFKLIIWQKWFIWSFPAYFHCSKIELRKSARAKIRDFQKFLERLVASGKRRRIFYSFSWSGGSVQSRYGEPVRLSKETGRFWATRQFHRSSSRTSHRYRAWWVFQRGQSFFLKFD